MKEKNNNTLLPCPFCGGDAEIKQISNNGIQVRCKHCLIGLKQKILRHSLDWLKDKMIQGWNKRTPNNTKKLNEMNLPCKELCERPYCFIYGCLHNSTLSQINKVLFEEKVDVLREFSDRGDLVSDLRKLIKKYEDKKLDSIKMIEIIKDFNINGAKVIRSN